MSTVRVHAYYYDEDGKKRGYPFLSTSSATEALKDAITDGVISVENEAALLEQIRSSGLSEGSEDESDVVAAIGISLDDILELIEGMTELVDVEVKGPFTLVVEDGDEGSIAHFVSANGFRTQTFYSQDQMRKAVIAMVRMKLLKEEEATKFLAEIEDSRLSED